jgi:hypothetical protein
MQWFDIAVSTLITGSSCNGNTTLLTRWVLPVMLWTQPDTISENTNQAAMPAVSHTANGTPAAGCTLNPTLKTTQKTAISTSGVTTCHTIPRIEQLPVAEYGFKKFHARNNQE